MRKVGGNTTLKEKRYLRTKMEKCRKKVGRIYMRKSGKDKGECRTDKTTLRGGQQKVNGQLKKGCKLEGFEVRDSNFAAAEHIKALL